MTAVVIIVIGTFLAALLIGSRRRANAAEWARTGFDPAAYGLVPRGGLDPGRAGPPVPSERRERSQAVADAAWGGNWRAAVAHVEAAGEDWDERWDRLELLAEIARQDDAWLTAWRAADPDNCDAATLEAKLMVHRAWAIRGGGFAHEVAPENMAEFRRLLPAAIDAARRAALLAPENPGPWAVMITAARGAQYAKDQFRPLWKGLVQRAPHHYEGHWQAMQYWCAKWHGSDRAMMAFARRALRKAPAGSPLAGLYLHALSELVSRNGPRAFPATAITKDRLKAVTKALATVPADDPRLPVLRHLLADFLGRAGMHRQAVEQFRLIGRWCGADPWTDYRDPVAAFDLARGVAVKLSRTKPLPVTMEFVGDALHHHG
ncbi:hypothetical protein [Kitasatospora camelliae]|uniref:DUF4034 domain-containing protein n=1 Tax=Kitasatospora camelliae TaxID=3156397 RepID=A0AAU8JPW9_9ACTN